MRYFLASIFTAICLFVGFLPEIVMVVLWGIIGPVGFWQKAATLFMFGTFGTGLCVLFGYIAFAFWVFLIGEIT